MNRLMHGLLAMASSTAVWADGETSNVTSTTWEIYGFIAVVFLVGVAWVLWKQKKEEKRDKPPESRSSNPV